ncbi:lipopolysaccharide biosynthesis protein [Sphingobacterium sp. NPDC055346]
MLKKIFSNPSVLYLLTRYLTYAIQFFNSIFIAVILGPSYLAIWGFILLVLQYFAQINLGIPHSLNAIISVNKSRVKYVRLVFNNSVFLVIIISLIIIMLTTLSYYFDYDIGDKYDFSQYALMVIIIAIMTYFIQIFSNLFRVFNKIFEVAFSQSLFPFLMIICVFIWKGDTLIENLLYANVLSCFVSLILFVIRCPIELRIQFNTSIIQKILVRGIYLFLYNSSFYLIMMSSRTFISGFFSQVEFGYFTFAFTVASAILLLLEAVNFLVYPKVLNKLGNSSIEDSSRTINSIREVYIISSYFLIFFAIVLFPIFVFVFPQYTNSIQAFRLISLTLALYTSCFGYSSLLISRGREKSLGLFAFFTLIINVLLSLFFIKVCGFPFALAILSTTISYLFYLITLNYYGQKELNPKIPFYNTVKLGFPYSIFIPYILMLVFSIIGLDAYIFVLPLIIFIYLNKNAIRNLIKVGMSIITNPSFFKF